MLRGCVATVSGETPDDILVQRVLAGQTRAFEELLHRHSPRLYRVARAILKSDTEAEDVLQQAYLSAYVHLHQFSGGARFSAWLTCIVVHEAIDHTRRRDRTVSMDSEPRPDEMELALGADPEQQALRGELHAMMEAAIDRLPATYRVVFVLREIEDMTSAETAAALGITPHAARTRLYRARLLLRDTLFRRGRTTGVENARAFLFHLAQPGRVVKSVLNRIRSLPR
jgi:RNA polymerase sigma-70 factor, ECF subfamily